MSGFFEPAAFERWKGDRMSGASALTREAAVLLAGALGRRGAAALPELPAALRAMATAHPAFGSLWRLADRVARVHAKAIQEAAGADETLERATESTRAFAADLSKAEAALALRAVELVSPGGLIAVYSRSGAVEATLLEARRQGLRFRVLLSEARPGLEGLAMARALGASGVECVLTADAMLPMLLGRAAVLLLGADAITPRGLVHKAGTYPLLLAARELNVPAHVLAVRAKFLSPAPGTLDLPLHPTEALLPGGTPGVEAINAPFEESPFALLRGVMTESGYLGVTEAPQAAQMAPLHASLRGQA
ncbi:MAG: hypothetical protein HZB25_01565 [Candidatus Eisenbacteria bacterium]|nr:hypothetical protein [Candidatus Eisenbacteria bacterium]